MDDFLKIATIVNAGPVGSDGYTRYYISRNSLMFMISELEADPEKFKQNLKKSLKARGMDGRSLRYKTK